MGEIEENSFIALPGKGGHSGLVPIRLCLTRDGVSEESLTVFREQGVVSSWTFFRLVGGEVNWESASSTFWFQLLWGLRA